MTERHWDKVRYEDLIRVRGTENVESDHSGGDGPPGYIEEPRWMTEPGRKIGDLYRAATSKSSADKVVRCILVKSLFETVRNGLDNQRKVNECTDAELRECREICERLIGRLGLEGIRAIQPQTAISRMQLSRTVASGPDLIMTIRAIDMFCAEGIPNGLPTTELRETCKSLVKNVNRRLLIRTRRGVLPKQR